jgi:integrase
VTRRKNKYPGVRKNVVKGRIYWKFERGDFRINIPGPYGSAEFLAAYEAALAGSKPSNRSTSIVGSLAWLIEQYLGSLKFQNLSDSRKRTIRLELDWIRTILGEAHFERLTVRHIEKLMSKKTGPTAANTVKKNMSMLFNFAAQKLGYTGPNPARHAERMKTNPDGYHTWTEAEVSQFLKRHGPGTKARLVMLLAINTGMSRTDLCRVGWQNAKGGRITYRRAKTGVAADLPILPELAEELARISTDRLLFIVQDKREIGYKPETLGNWFRDRCKEAEVPGSLHGLRKAGATRLANAQATPDEIKAFLAHATNAQGSIYTRAADRGKQADSAFAKLANMSNPSSQLDNKKGKANE